MSYDEWNVNALTDLAVGTRIRATTLGMSGPRVWEGTITGPYDTVGGQRAVGLELDDGRAIAVRVLDLTRLEVAR